MAEAFYSVNVMVEFDDVVYGEIDVNLVSDGDGYIDGNSIQISQQITSWVRHVDPDVNFNFAFLATGNIFGAALAVADYYARLEAIESYYTKDNIRDVAMSYELSSSDEMDEVDEGTSEDVWEVSDNSEGYKYEATKTDDVIGTFALEAGINFHPSAYLNYAYAVPTVACWSFGAECDLEWSKSSENAGDYGEGLSYDVFLSTIDGFLTLSSQDGAYSLGWDENFGTLADADGDELLSGSINVLGNALDGTYEILSGMVARSIPSASGSWDFTVADKETLTTNHVGTANGKVYWSNDPNGGIEPFLFYKSNNASSYSSVWYPGWVGKYDFRGTI